MTRRGRTHEQFVSDMKEMFPNITILGTYVNAETKLDFKCECGHKWTTKPKVFYMGCNCPNCARRQSAEKHSVTYDEFMQRFFDRTHDIEILTPFENSKKRIKLKCNVCEYEWSPYPLAFFQTTCKCPQCSGGLKNKTHEIFVSQMKKVNKDIIFLDKYKTAIEDLLCKCTICGNEWHSKPSNLLHGYGCPACALKNRTKNISDFILELYEINPNIEVIGDYVTNKIPIKCKCKICKHEWNAKPINLIHGTGCPQCGMSKGEIRCQKYFDAHNIRYESYKEYDGLVGLKNGLLSYDFYLPDYNMLLEYQGEFHDGKANEYVARNIDVQQEHDRRKRQYAIDHNIELLEIWYWDFDNIENILHDRLGV